MSTVSKGEKKSEVMAPNGADSTPFDPFDDLEALRLRQSVTDTIGVKKVLTTVQVRRPSRQEFFRVHPDSNYRMDVGLLKVESDNELYLVAPALHHEILAEMTTATLYTVVTTQSVVSLWPISLPDPERRNSWLESAAKAALMATQQWVRIVSNRAAKSYDTFTALGNLADPEWPEIPFKELLRLAFHTRFIDSRDHFLMRKLRGEV